MVHRHYQGRCDTQPGKTCKYGFPFRQITVEETLDEDGVRVMYRRTLPADDENVSSYMLESTLM